MLVLVVAVLVGVVVAGFPTAAAPGPGDQVALQGTVTGTDGAPAGDAVVLIGEYSMLSKLSPDELRDVAADDPDGLTVVSVDGEGRFSATVSWKRADTAVALNDAGISDVERVGHQNTTLSFRLHEHRPQRIHATSVAVSADEHGGDLLLSLVNNGDATVENLSVTLASLPEGWSVGEVETGGVYHPATNTITWRSVPPGAEVDTTVVLTVPADAAVGEYSVDLRARSDTHPISVPPVTVELLPEETAGPTTTSLPMGDEETGTTAGGDGTATRSERSSRRSSTATSTPGFAVATAVVALALATGLLGRRR